MIRCNLGVGCDEANMCYARRNKEPKMCGCQDCGGTGEVFTHSPECDDDLCALNGDIHSCYGLVLQCECAMTPNPQDQARVASPASAVRPYK